MCYILIAILLIIAIYLYHTNESFYLEGNMIRPTYDPEVVQASGMDYQAAVNKLYE